MRQVRDIQRNILDKKTVESLFKSEENIKKNRTKKATEVMKEFKAKYGF